MILGRIEAEAFTNQFGVQTETTSDVGGGLNVGYIQNGDFVEYQINVPTAGLYQVQFRVASNTAGGTINILAAGKNVGAVTVANTGGWQAWTSVSKAIQLTAGPQVLRLNFAGSGNYLFNLNWMNFSLSTGSSSISSSRASSSSSSQASSAVNGLVCSHVIIDQWSQGFTAGVRVSNNSSTPITGWSITWQYADGSRVTNTWNATVTGNNPYLAQPLSWMTTINPGQTIEVGVQGVKGVANGSAPTAAVACN